MFDSRYRGTAMALAVVSMFLLSALAVMITPSDAARDTYPQTEDPYQIYMFTGDTFTYEPTANLEGTQFSWALTGIASGDAQYNTTAKTQSVTEPKTAYLRYTPSSATTSAKVVLTANHASSNQTITQEILFKVTDHMAISASYNGGASTNVGFNPAVTVPVDTSSYQAVFTVSNGLNPLFDISGYVVKYKPLDGDTYSEILGSDFTKSTTGQTFTISFDHVIASGFYQFSVPVGWHKDYDTQGEDGMIRGNSESETLTFTLIVSDGVSVPEVTVVGIASESRSKTIEISNVSSVSSMNFSFQPVNTLSGAAATLNQHTSIALADPSDFSRAVITLDATSITNQDLNGNSLSYDLNINVAGMRTFGTSETEFSSTGLAHVNLYKSLAFTTSPVISAGGTNVYVSSNNGLDVLLTTSITGAQKITYDWGDGTVFVKDASTASGTYFSANHTYAKSGTYFIQITASNDFGETTYVTPYTTTGAIIEWDSDKAVDMTGIKTTEAENGTELVLEPIVVMTKGNSISYKWTYTDGDSVREITPAEKPAWVKSITEGGSKLTVFKKGDSTVPDNTKLTCTATVSFSGETEPATASASYTFHSEGNDNWTWILSFVAITVMCVAGIVFFGPDMILLVVGGFSSIAALVMLVMQLFF